MFDSRTASGAALAYLGDAVLEVLVRTRLVEAGYASSKSLNAHALEYVRAGAQARAMERIRPLLGKPGYIPALDHLIPPEVSFTDYTYFVNRLRGMILGEI